MRAGESIRGSRLAAAAIVLLFGGWSCSSEPPSQPQPAGDFPNSVGDTWVYEVADSVEHTTDTLTVRNTQEIMIPRFGRVTVQELASSRGTDIRYVSMSADTIRVLQCVPESTVPCLVQTEYLYPLEVGKQWDRGFYAGSTTVVERNLISTRAGGFPTAFRLEQNWYALNEWGDATTWMVPGVGVVHLRVRAHLWTSRLNQTWELIDYELATSPP